MGVALFHKVSPFAPLRVTEYMKVTSGHSESWLVTLTSATRRWFERWGPHMQDLEQGFRLRPAVEAEYVRALVESHWQFKMVAREATTFSHMRFTISADLQKQICAGILSRNAGRSKM